MHTVNQMLEFSINYVVLLVEVNFKVFHSDMHTEVPRKPLSSSFEIVVEDYSVVELEYLRPLSLGLT